MIEPPNAAIVALSLALLTPQGAWAQIDSRLEAGAIMTHEDGELPASTMRVAPGIRVALPFVNVSANGSAWLQGQQWQIAEGTISASVLSPTFHSVRAELIANASRAFFDRATGNDQIDGQARVHLLFNQRGGIWVGGGVARPWRVAVVSHVDIASGGAWRRFGGATVSGTYTNFFFTKVTSASDSSGSVTCTSVDTRDIQVPELESAAVAAAPASSSCRRYSRFSDVEGSLHWEHGFFELSAHTGYRFGNASDVTRESRRWAAGTATLWLSDQVAAVIGGGRIPANPSRGLPARNFANVGVMLAYAPVPRNAVPVATRLATVRGFEVRPAAQEGMQRITLRVGGVETVEVMGDFSDWSTLQMIRRGRDLWELLLPLHKGVHQMNIRLDGGPWLPPPNVPVIRDGYDGEVGVVVVP